jgi:hypothetical protein
VDKCVDLKGGGCWLETQAEQEALWGLTASWVANFTDAGDKPMPEPPVPPAAAGCPKLLEPLCKLTNETKCIAQCAKPAAACVGDEECRASMGKSTACFAKLAAQGRMDEALACLVPDNKLRDDVYECLMDDHSCLPTPPGPTYPSCRDTELKGDASFSLAHLQGDWWKVRGWTAGEPYECRPCGRVTFGGSPRPQTVWINSSWLEKDIDNVTWPMVDSSYFGVRADGEGFPTKLAHTGAMLGLRYVENFTILHDGRHEAEPFLFMYGCGATKQGAYTTGFAIAQAKTASAALDAKIRSIATANGFGADEWCVVNNTCPN